MSILDSISKVDIQSATRNYAFPMQEELFSFPLEGLAQTPGLEWACATRPVLGATWSIPDFWVSSFYNSLEDVFADDLFESLAAVSIWETRSHQDDIAEQIIDFLRSEERGALRICGAIDYMIALNSNGFRGLIGLDDNGLFSVIWKCRVQDQPAIHSTEYAEVKT